MTSVSFCKDGKPFPKSDGYDTPDSAWKSISHLIPKDKVIWEAFLLNNTTTSSVNTLRELGHNVMGDPSLNFFEHDIGDIIVSNPPFSKKISIFKRLALLDKPFILILPISTITKQFVKVLELDKLQMVIPNKRMHFLKDGEEKNRCFFDTVFLCYKLNLEHDIIYLKN